MFNLDQEELTTISTFGFTVVLLSFSFGVISDRFGVQYVNSTSGSLMTTGLLCMVLVFLGYIPGTVPILSVIYSLCCVAYCDLCSLLPNLAVFKLHQGDIIIIQKTFVGLGSAIFTSAYVALGDIVSYCVALAVCTLLTQYLCAFIIRVPPASSTLESSPPGAYKVPHASELEQAMIGRYMHTSRAAPGPRRLGVALMLASLVYATCIGALDAFEILNQLSHWKQVWLALGSFFLLIMYPILLPITARRQCVRHVEREVIRIFPPTSSSLLSSSAELSFRVNTRGDKNTSPFAQTERMGVSNSLRANKAAFSSSSEAEVIRKQRNDELPQIHNQVVPFATICRPYKSSIGKTLTTNLNYWLLWFVTFGSLGTGLVISGNLNSIIRASMALPFGPNVTMEQHLRGQRATATAMMISGIGSAAGRLTVGIMEQRYPQTSTSAFLSYFCFISPFSCFLLAMPPQGAADWILFLPFFTQPFAFGAVWAVLVLMMRMMFLKNIGQHIGILYFAGIAGIWILNRGMFGTLYDREARRLNSYPFCASSTCIRPQMIILGCLNVAASLVSCLLHVRWMHRHSQQSSLTTGAKIRRRKDGLRIRREKRRSKFGSRDYHKNDPKNGMASSDVLPTPSRPLNPDDHLC